ncbi:MAG TPA: TauD/TfdA family dioxygenase [Acidimicrobiales bacterium]|jgi:taurine dioxygenase|nr:TauD/TfdA family dioxygenase [Acidimicrobiales bacterium]
MTDIKSPTKLDITRLSGTIGAELRGVDLRGPLDSGTVGEIRQALVDFKVIFFPGQHLSAAEHKEFALNFGEITNAHPVIPGVDEHKEVFEIDYTKARQMFDARKQEKDGERSRNPWHTDVTFMDHPPLGSILNAIVIPAAGGDTAFADTQAAYEALSEPFRQFLGGLQAVHDGRPAFQKLLDQLGEGEWDGERITNIPPVKHPVVRTHPESGRKSLFVNPGFTDRIDGLDRRESDAILAFLYEHMTRQEFLVRYRWDEGDLGFWDNRSTMHYAVSDYGDAHRVIQRVTIRGDRPY